MHLNITTKFTVSILAIVLLVLSGSAVVSVARERSLFERDMAHDAQALAATLATPFSEAWQRKGEPGALSFLASAASNTTELSISWSTFGALRGFWATAAARLQKPFDSTSFVMKTGEVESLVTIVSIPLPGPEGVMVIQESTANERIYLRQSIRNHLIGLGLLMMLAGLGTWYVGSHFVGRPMHLLLRKTERIGQNDLSGPVVLKQQDELRTLADSLNDMCQGLDRSRTQLKQETEARLAAVDQMRHSERLATVGLLASGVAHEMGTPLNVVLGRASMILEAKSPDQIAAHVKVIERQVTRMAEIIRGLLDFSRSAPWKRIPTSAHDIVKSVARMLGPLAQTAGIQIALDESQGNVTLVADRGQLEQVLSNLIMNAVQAGHRGGQVHLWCERVAEGAAKGGPSGETIAGKAVAIHVDDDGQGMHDEVRARIFEPFFTTKDVGDGTGLGLSVSHGIIQEHGGFISVQSSPGSGSQFCVYLPATAE